MKQIYIDSIAERLQVKDWQVENCVKLFEEGATIPFISRYRKERTGGLDEVAVAEVRHWHDVFSEMEKRKATILETISEAGALTQELRSRIENSVESRELEDLYLPFRPKRRTRATVASRYHMKLAENGGITNDDYIKRPEETDGSNSNFTFFFCSTSSQVRGGSSQPKKACHWKPRLNCVPQVAVLQ